MSGERIDNARDAERASLAMELPIEAKENKIKVLVLQHPQEPDKVLGSAALLVRGLSFAKLKVGLSWSSLSRALGEDAIPTEWAVLYLGAKGKHYPETVNFVNKKGDVVSMPETIRGLVVLDGTWSQAKALWWRNAWLLKLKRVVLQPKAPSRYGRLRKEPRREAVSTIESVAMVLGKLDPEGALLQSHLEDGFQRMLDAYKQKKSATMP